MTSQVAGDRASTSGEDGSSGSGGELAREQRVVDVVYARLDELREQYRERLSDVRAGGSVGTHQMRSERDAFAQHYTETLARMDQVEDRLVFGRLDLVDGPPRYVGRIGIQDAGRSQLLLDWRAPSARPFYQATAVNPDGAVRRRHLQTRRRTVVGIEDELLDADNLSDDLRLELRGEGALFAAMNEARTGHMTDIVATIQAEQDAVVRSDVDGVLVVQGGPGTGKTAVALHRIAYLLYAHRERLARSGVLLVGPSPVFLAYVDQVLPSLGETDVIATTIADLVPGVRARGAEDAAVAEIKGRNLMASAMRRLVRAHQRVPDSPRRLEVEGAVLTLRPGDVRHAISRARRAYPTHNQGWETFVRTLVPILTDQYAAARGVSDPAERPDLMEDVRSSREVRVAINLCWMPRTPTELLERFYARPDLLAACAPELTPRERELLRRSPGSDLTEADVPLIDELAELLGPHEGAARAGRPARPGGHRGPGPRRRHGRRRDARRPVRGLRAVAHHGGEGGRRPLVDLRPRGGRRGPGAEPDGVAHARPPGAREVDDGGRRPRPAPRHHACDLLVGPARTRGRSRAAGVRPHGLLPDPRHHSRRRDPRPRRDRSAADPPGDRRPRHPGIADDGTRPGRTAGRRGRGRGGGRPDRARRAGRRRGTGRDRR
jgi:hypothetical protein